jgi:hypothetical protein
MVLPDLSPLEKLWNKGVDIAATTVASTLSAVLVATIALVGWKWKLRLELKKEEASQRQKERINDELAHERTTAARRDQADRLQAQLAALATEAMNIREGIDVEILSHRYVDWLEETKLTMWKQNLARFNRWRDVPYMNLEESDFPLLAADIRATEIPAPDETEFPW